LKIIITDAYSRKSFDVINILKNKYNFDLLLFSKKGYRVQLPIVYGQKVYRLRDENYECFQEDFINVINEYENEELIFFPLSEERILDFYDFLEEDSNYDISYLLPERDIFELSRNKKEFQRYCETHNIPIPKSYVKDDIDSLAVNFRPVVAKLQVGAGSVGMKYVDKVENLHVLHEIDYDKYLIQEKITSERGIHGGFFLCKKGEVKSYYGHKRIRTFPEKGGVTVFSKSELNKEIKQIGSQLLKKMNWDGLAMIEFMHDKESDTWKVIELNPRLWGSILLAEFCNSDLILNYINLCRKIDVNEIKPNTDRYIKWIFPFEILSFLKGKIGIKDLLNLDKKKICYINVTYGRWLSVILFQLYFTFNFSSVKRFFKKLFS